MIEYEYQVETIYIWNSDVVETAYFANMHQALEYAEYQNRYYNFEGNEYVQIVISPMFKLEVTDE